MPSGSHFRGPLLGQPAGQVGPSFKARQPDPLEAVPLGGLVPGTLIRDYFLSRLPPQGLNYFHRKYSFQGTTVMAAVGQFQRKLFTLAANQSLLLMDLRSFWLDVGDDPLDPDATTPFGDQSEVNGKTGFTILWNKHDLFDAQELLVDNTGGVPVTRAVNGFTTLNANLLDIGVHPTAAYVLDGATIQAQWDITAIPAHIPTMIGCTLRGYTVTTTQLYKVLLGVRDGSDPNTGQ